MFFSHFDLSLVDWSIPIYIFGIIALEMVVAITNSMLVQVEKIVWSKHKNIN